jgi:hypothetical protein
MLSQKGDFLLLKWIPESHRPISIVEDAGFNEFVAFVNALEEKYVMLSRMRMTR